MEKVYLGNSVLFSNTKFVSASLYGCVGSGLARVCKYFAYMTDEWKKAPLAFKGLYTLDGVSVEGKWDNGKINIMLHPNGASNIKIKVSDVTGVISVAGEKNKVKSFNAGEILILEFDGDKPIRLFN